MNSQDRILIAEKAVAEALAKSEVSYLSVKKFSHNYPRPMYQRVVGSSYISDNTNSDIDVLVLVSSLPDPGSFYGWVYGGSRNLGEDDAWLSYKKIVDGIVVNMLLVYTYDYYRKWVDATEVCRFIHQQGISLTTGTVHGVHAILMDGTDAEHEKNIRGY